MTIRKLTAIAALMMALTGIFTGQALADKAQLTRKLNQDIEVDLNNVTIAEALKQIGEKVGVEFVLSEAAKWKLPYGEATKLPESIEGQGPAAGALTKMLGDLFMRYAVGSEKVTIYPRPELNHIIGTPTIEQLTLLKKTYTSVITFGAPNGSKIFGKMLSQGLGGGPSIVILPVTEYTGILCPFIDDLTTGLKGDGDQSPPMTLFQLLESVKAINGDEWYISGSDFARNVIEIHMVDESEFLQSVILDQMADISFENEKAEAVIEHLKMLTESRLEVYKNDPSWLVDDRISVNMQNVKLSEAIKNIATALDGKWAFSSDRVEIQGPVGRITRPAPRPTASTPRSSAAAGYVGKISIPMDDGKYFLEFMLRESDLTEELRKLRELKIKEIMKKAAAEMAGSMVEARFGDALIKASQGTAKPRK